MHQRLMRASLISPAGNDRASFVVGALCESTIETRTATTTLLASITVVRERVRLTACAQLA